MYRHFLEITVNPTDDVPLDIDSQKDKPKWLSFKWPWRINQLAVPKHITEKFVSCPESEIIEKFEWPALDQEVIFRTENLAWPFVSTLKNVKGQYKDISPKWHQRMAKHIDNSWKTIYNHYNLQVLKKLQRNQVKLRQAKTQKYDPKAMQKICDQRQARLTNLAQPKTLKLPEGEQPPKSTISLCDMYKDMELLAAPKPYKAPDIKYLGFVSDAAKKYKATDNIIKLAQKKTVKGDTRPPLVPGVVKRSALTYPIKEALVKLATPSVRATKKDNVQDEEEPAISPNALKYKATEKILQLAKPKEQEEEKPEKLSQYGIRPGALKYNATERILELARPLHITPKKVTPG